MKHVKFMSFSLLRVFCLVNFYRMNLNRAIIGMDSDVKQVDGQDKYNLHNK